MIKGRILWLLNHSALLNREVPILIELGYEVFVPKIALFDVSSDITYKYDDSLSIPGCDLMKLNQVDFYAGNIEPDVLNIMNRYFDICLFAHNANLTQVLVNKFQGVLGYRAFGRISAEGTHTEFIVHDLGLGYLKKIEKLSDRFFFLHISENIVEKECDFFRNHALYVPIGFEKGVVAKDEWEGGVNKLLFVCPRIKMSSYFENIYKEFIRDFRDIPYVIAGAQPIKIEEDSNVLGYLSKDKYQALFKECKVMFYHSQEPSHIHYHPLEAIMVGMPLVYMAKGQFDYLGGTDLPGRCETIEEARKKIKKILRGDKKLINKIKQSQNVLVDKYMYEFCRDKWKAALEIIESAKKNVTERKEVKKLAIILPQKYKGGVLDYTLRIVHAIKRGADLRGDLLEITLGYNDYVDFEKENDFDLLKKNGIKLRKFVWEKISTERANEILKLLNLDVRKEAGDYVLLNDGMNYFADCDYLLFTADRIPGRLICMSPYGMIAHDYIQRYLPEIVDKKLEIYFLESIRKADAVFTTTYITKNDCIQYAGVAERKIHLLPLFFDEIKDISRYSAECKYFLWSTNVSPHKNHKTVLKALEKYYANGGKLECYMTGTFVEKFDINKEYDGENDYIKEIREIISGDDNLQEHIRVWGNLPKKKYLTILGGAEFFLHAGYADNGNGTAFDAAMLNVPSVSSYYPAMRNMDMVLGLNMQFFDKKDSNQLAEILQYMEIKIEDIKASMPGYEKLRKFTVQDDDCCKDIYRVIKDNSAI